MLDLKFYYYLPYSIRRYFFSKVYKSDYRWFSDLRSGLAEEGYSCQPFLDNKCIFVHIPKAAGISVCKSLFDCLGGGHSRIRDYQIIFSKKEYDECFKFTFVRNPWSRVFSAYIFLMAGGVNEQDRQFSEEYLHRYSDFNSFVKGWLNTSNIHKKVHFKPQCEFVEIPGRRQVAVDYVGFFENMEDDYCFIKSKIITQGERPLQFLNKTMSTNRLDYIKAYDCKSRDIVSNLYEKDIDIFGYTFDNSSLREQICSRDTKFKLSSEN